MIWFSFMMNYNYLLESYKENEREEERERMRGGERMRRGERERENFFHAQINSPSAHNYWTAGASSGSPGAAQACRCPPLPSFPRPLAEKMGWQ